jgi:two-component system cell cycle response regulator
MTAPDSSSVRILAPRSLSEALERLAGEERFDVVLFDLRLGPCGGSDGLAELLKRAPDIPLVALTPDGDETLGLTALRRGAEDAVAGSLPPEHLERAIRNAVERHRLHKTLLRQALTDDLTGLYNRRAFLMFAAHQLAQARRNGKVLILLFADLDELKAFNDTQGHEAGDRAIAAAAGALRATFRNSDLVARLGGDEFVAMMMESTADPAPVVTKRLQENLAACALSMSVGMTRIQPDDKSSLEDLLARADALLYDQKKARPRVA